MMLRAAAVNAARRSAARPAWQAVRGLADAKKGGEEEDALPPAQRPKDMDEVRAENMLYAVPDLSREFVVGPDTVPAVPEEGAQEEWEGIVSYVPEELKANRTVIVYKRPISAMEEGWDVNKAWTLRMDNKPYWTNQLMKYESSADPLSVTGLEHMCFDTAEEAQAFCRRQGWSFEVDEPPLVESTEGKRSYAMNFLNQHIMVRRAKWEPAKLMKEQFKHAESGKTCWVNLKHTNYGATESKKVSGTHWSDPHPANHKATDWYMDNIGKKQELARKLGK